MGIRLSLNGSTLTAFIEGDIDHHSAKDIRETIDHHIEKNNPRIVKLDFSGVPFMDSSGIGLIMGRFKLVSSLKGSLKVVNVPQNLERMIKLSGLSALGIFEKEDKKINARSNK